MRVIQLVDQLGIESLVQNELPKPQPTPDQVLVKLEAASLNYVDLLVIKGLLNPHLKLPYVPICDGAGIVEQVGAGVTTFKPGNPGAKADGW
jgi:NADPH:quinone reductase-like Zn-dependent oxidoreductase